MEAVLGLFLILLRVSHGMENFCDGRQNEGQCYGPLGGTLVLQLMDKVNDKGTVLLKNSTKTLLEIKQGSIRYYIENKFFFTPDNGTLRINNLSRTDSGEYKVSLYYEGRLNKTQTVNIHVQAPVSSVSFSTECLFLGEMKVSCSSQRGDDPQYSWTLNGSPLTENELLSGNHLNKTITLKQHVHGLLKCSVSNYISHSSYTEQISTCGMENFCDGRQNGAQCYGPLGGTLVLQLMDKVPPGTVLLKNSTQTLLEIKQGSIRYHIENKFFFTLDNGTLRINNLSRTDSGEYKVSLYHEARLSKTQTVNIHVQAPVSSVSFSTECLFLGEMKVSCSSQRGDDPQYSWTLNGSPLTENELLSGNHLNKTITLKQHVHGLLKCSVSNYISHSSYTDQISTCGMENFCDGRQNGAQFYGPLGGTLVLQLMDKVPPGTVLFRNSTQILLEIKQGSIRYYTENKFFFTPDNGTLRINNLSRTDSGEYKVSLYYEGRLIKTQTVNIHVQAPVSSVSFSTECLFLGGMKVSCSSQRGDDPQYSWTLNGSPLTENELLSGNHLNKTITLKQHVHGLLKCSVSNYISHSSYTDQISTCGMENFCDGRQNGAQFYGPLGGTLVLQLMNKVPPGTVLFRNSTQILLEIKQGSIRYYTENKFFFTPDNGTLRINNLSRTDSGEHKVSLYYEGRLIKTQTVNIHVQAPVSSVSFSTVCLFLGEMKVSCSSQRGDDPQYSWTLNGSPLTENELLSGNHLNKTITLKQHVHGLLKCSVSNYISHSSYTEQISTCAYWQVMVALLIARVLLMLVGVFVVITNLKKANNQGKVTAGADDQELTYPATHTLQRRQLKMKTEDEEENDQVFFRGKMRKTAKPIQDEHTNDNVAKREPRQQPH